MEDSMAWYWCCGCWQWHSVERPPSTHRLLAFMPEQPPTDKNFGGTSKELRRFKIGYELRKTDRELAIIQFEQRIDAALGTVWQRVIDKSKKEGERE